MRRRSTRTAIGLALALALGACGDDGGPATPGANDGTDAGGARDGSTPGAGGNGDGTRLDGSLSDGPSDGDGDSEATTCGTTRCADVAPALAALGAHACCTAEDGCGIETPLAPDACLTADAPGGADLACPPLALSELGTWNGCCNADGQCGALDPSGTLGCVANSNLGAAALSCTYDPSNTCERILEVRCDGAEDCSGGRMCCGEFDGAGYRVFRCATSCAAREQTTGSVWSQACHPGEACETAGFECRSHPGYLPGSLYRCRDAGYVATTPHSTAPAEIHCGTGVCGAGQKCCVSFPGAVAHCAPADAPCACLLDAPVADDGGTDDGG